MPCKYSFSSTSGACAHQPSKLTWSTVLWLYTQPYWPMRTDLKDVRSNKEVQHSQLLPCISFVKHKFSLTHRWQTMQRKQTCMFTLAQVWTHGAHNLTAFSNSLDCPRHSPLNNGVLMDGKITCASVSPDSRVKDRCWRLSQLPLKVSEMYKIQTKKKTKTSYTSGSSPAVTKTSHQTEGDQK